MPNVFRFRRTSVPPEPNRNSEAVYANADGELKQVAPDGSETDLGGGGGGGGSQPWKIERVPIAFDTPNLVVTGIPIYTPTVGDLLALLAVSITTAWNGTLPKLEIFEQGIDYNAVGGLLGIDVDVEDSQAEAGGTILQFQTGFNVNFNTYRFATTTPLCAAIDNQNGVDPGATQGAGEIILGVIPPAS